MVSGLSPAKPRWREWVPETNVVARREVFTVTKELLHRMLDDVALNGMRWEDLIGALARSPQSSTKQSSAGSALSTQLNCSLRIRP